MQSANFHAQLRLVGPQLVLVVRATFVRETMCQLRTVRLTIYLTIASSQRCPRFRRLLDRRYHRWFDEPIAGCSSSNLRSRPLNGWWPTPFPRSAPRHPEDQQYCASYNTILPSDSNLMEAGRQASPTTDETPPGSGDRLQISSRTSAERCVTCFERGPRKVQDMLPSHEDDLSVVTGGTQQLACSTGGSCFWADCRRRLPSSGPIELRFVST